VPRSLRHDLCCFLDQGSDNVGRWSNLAHQSDRLSRVNRKIVDVTLSATEQAGNRVPLYRVAIGRPANLLARGDRPMRATVMHKAHDVRLEIVPDAAIQQPTDAVIRVTRACICGSDLWPYNGGPNEAGQRMGHEAIGVVEEVGSGVQTLRRGQVVVMPFASSDGSCLFCDEGLPTSCIHVGFSTQRLSAGLRAWISDGRPYPLSLWSHEGEGVLGAEHMTVQVRDPLSPCRGDVEVVDRFLQMR